MDSETSSIISQALASLPTEQEEPQVKKQKKSRKAKDALACPTCKATMTADDLVNDTQYACKCGHTGTKEELQTESQKPAPEVAKATKKAKVPKLEKGRDIAALMTSDKQNWETPPDLFQVLNAAFHFELDPCTTHENPLGTKYFLTPNQNGLEQDWTFNAFVNPPFRQVKLWVKKALMEANRNKTTVVVIMANRTETNAAQVYGFPGCHAVCFMDKRVSFIDPDRREQRLSPTFGSMLLIFQPSPLTAEQYKVLRELGYVFEQKPTV